MVFWDKKELLCCFLLSFVVLIGCGDTHYPLEPYSYTELAMEPGMIIEATNKNGTVTIEYLSPLKRRYRWGDFDEIRTLIPRQERWRGKLGAYDPATKYFWEFFKRIVANDSQLHFESMDEIERWLYQGSSIMDWVYTDDGLVVGFSESESRDQVNINVYQIYLGGEKPTAIPGSRPEKIKVRFKNM